MSIRFWLLATGMAAALMGNAAQAADPVKRNTVSTLGNAAGMNVERYTVGRTDPLHQWLQRAVGPVRLADEIVIAMHYFPIAGRSAVDASPMRAVVRELDSGRSKSITSPMPDPPGGNPPIGTTDQVSVHCDTMKLGTRVTLTGQTTYEWEYGYTVDTNGDGENDAEPGWYITGMSFSAYSLQDAVLC
jgi:hypothetical protein